MGAKFKAHVSGSFAFNKQINKPVKKGQFQLTVTLNSHNDNR